jgi:hypothetical protein
VCLPSTVNTFACDEIIRLGSIKGGLVHPSVYLSVLILCCL